METVIHDSFGVVLDSYWGRGAVVNPLDNLPGVCYWCSSLWKMEPKRQCFSFWIVLHPGQPYLRDQPGTSPCEGYHALPCWCWGRGLPRTSLSLLVKPLEPPGALEPPVASRRAGDKLPKTRQSPSLLTSGSCILSHVPLVLTPDLPIPAPGHLPCPAHTHQVLLNKACFV